MALLLMVAHSARLHPSAGILSLPPTPFPVPPCCTPHQAMPARLSHNPLPCPLCCSGNAGQVTASRQRLIEFRSQQQQQPVLMLPSASAAAMDTQQGQYRCD